MARRLNMRALLGVLFTLFAAGLAPSPAAAQSVAVRTALFQSSPCAGTTLKADFIASVYCSGGASYGAFAQLPGLTVARASVGYDLAGTRQFPANVARVVSGFGLLGEAALTNALQNSQDFTTASWGKTAVTTVAAAAVAPDGTLTANKLNDVAGSGLHQLLTTGFSVTSGTPYTFTLYAKAAELRYIWIDCFDSVVDYGAVFDLQTGAFSAARNANAISTSVTAAGGGWYRIALTFTATGTGFSNFWAQIGLAGGPVWVNTSYTAAGSQGVYIWQGDTPPTAFTQSPIVTAGASATRAADSIKFFASSPASDYRIKGGITTSRATSATRTVFDWNDGTDANKVILEVNSSNQILLRVINASASTTIATEGGTPAAARTATWEVRRTGGNWSLYVNEALVATSAAAAPSATSLQLANNRGLTVALNDYLTGLVVYPY